LAAARTSRSLANYNFPLSLALCANTSYAFIIEYLERNNLPNENLVVSVSNNRAIADFSFMYKGGGRCINFIVKCYGNDCSSLQKYPYDEHGEKCP
jgi:hypothetical protein